MFDRGSVAASFGLIIVSKWQELQQLYQMFVRSVAASFGLIIVSNEHQ